MEEQINDILRRRGALHVINGHRMYTEASVKCAIKEALQQVKTCAIQIVTCCGFSVGDKVNTPYSEGEVWKVTETSVHVKHWDEKREAWMFSKYLTEPYHHSQNPVTVLSHCR